MLSKSKILCIFLVLLSFCVFGQGTVKKATINVTGIYKYVGVTTRMGDDTYGSFGNIKVKQLDGNNIAISFYFNAGAKSYNTGSFVDTLTLKENSAIYKIPECDTFCTLTFKFYKTGVRAIHRPNNNDYNFSCCFGQGVNANGYFKKISSKTPIIVDPVP